MIQQVLKFVKKVKYTILAKRHDMKATAALDRALDFDFCDDGRFDHEEEFAKHCDLARHFRTLATHG